MNKYVLFAGALALIVISLTSPLKSPETSMAIGLVFMGLASK